MAFPETNLPIKVHLSLDGSTWTDVSADVRYQDKIRITRGRSDWGQQVDFGRCNFALSNTNGKYSPRNPEGTYYGQIGRNTPVRVSVETGSVALDLPGAEGDYASTPDAAALDITGDLDVRFDATLANWCLADYPTGSGTDYDHTELMGKAASGQVSWNLYVRLSKLHLTWSTNGTALTSASSTADLPLTTSGRLAVRATLDVDNGASGHTVTFYTSDSISGTWTQLGDAVTGSGTTSIHSGTAALRVGSIPDVSYSEAIGLVHAVEVRSGIAGTAVANPNFTAQASGTTSFADAAGRTWTVAGTAAITNRKTRFVGEISSWTPRWDTGGFDVVTQVEAAGILRRLGLGAVPLKSPIYREATSPLRTAVVAYWPLEDGAEATEFGSAIDGHPAVKLTGSVTPAAYSDWVGSDAIPTVGTGSMRVSVPTYGTDGSNSYNQLFFFAKVPTAGVVSTQRLVSVSTTGQAATWSLYVNTAGLLDMRAYDSDGTQIHSSGFSGTSINGREKLIAIRWGPPVFVEYVVSVTDVAGSKATAVPDNVLDSFTITNTVNATSVVRLSEIRFGEDGAMNSTAIGHVVVGNTSTAFNGFAAPGVGWNAEEAPSRVTRLGTEEGIHAYATGSGDEQMGVQARSTAVDLMRSAEAVDKGILAELRNVLGIRYVTRASMYSQPVTLSLNYTGDDGLVAPLDPVDDDQSVTNDVTEQREGGASARAVLTSGTLSTAAPPNGIGLYDTSYTTNLLDDTQPAQHAAWRLHLGTWDETRFPQVAVNLAGAPASIENAAAVDVGSRIQITNPPVWLPPDTLDLLVQGYSETLDQRAWNITYNCTPAGPFNVAWAGDDDSATAERDLSWADTEGTTLAEALTATETDVDVLTTSGPTWTDDASDTPFDWRVGGEVMTVTAPHSLLNTNPFYDTSVTGWTAVSCSIAHSTAVIHPHPRALGSAFVTPAGGANCRIQATNTGAGTVNPGGPHQAVAWVWSPTTWNGFQVQVNWRDSGGTLISTSSGTVTTAPAGEWTLLDETFTAPSTASQAQVIVQQTGTPAAGNTWYAWAVRVTRAKASSLYDTFTRSVTDSWGTSDSGHTWLLTGTAADYDITGTYGTQTNPSAGSAHIARITAPSADSDFVVDIATGATATGAALVAGPVSRCTGNSNFYTVRIAFNTSGTITMILQKRVSSVDTTLASYTAPYTHAAGTFYRVRLQTIGSAVKGKFWRVGDLEPGAWQMEATDTALTAAEGIGVRCFRDTGNTNANAEFRFQNFEVTNPQTYTVTRSVNGVTKTHAAGATVALAYPAYAAL
ncbi:hypothetical protein [Streptomyces cupreus]|uniref:Uncharacterized protein n=1 Tax=Streptomyces cupreus TaxID=2759956 RepID=A0A7X1J2S4_9ACTN|nr:hypothetical protein [Streptomyces cupreus]MBC2903135.1 hypothetical protein [Streptomyces cupreus]